MITKNLSLLFLTKPGYVLLAMKKTGFGEGRWNGVGGKVEAGEAIEEALVREAQEEIGVIPITYEKVADIRFDEFFEGEPALMHVHVFMATDWQGEPVESEEMAPQWFALAAIPDTNMWSNDRIWLAEVLKGKKISADFKLNETDEIVSQSIKEVPGFEA